MQANNTGGNPQVRLMALTECSTHALIDAAFDAVTRSSEFTLGRTLLASLSNGMRLLADRYFAGYALWADTRATGTHLLWRVKNSHIFTPLRILPNGSYLSIMPTPAETRRLGQARARGKQNTKPPQGRLARIIEYRITIRATDGTTHTEHYRLATSLLDHRQAPAHRLATTHHQRWEIDEG